tara:strand:- start:7985 stop:8182 length:198 start_codon:yes stop_codon:yes gene_type:complete
MTTQLHINRNSQTNKITSIIVNDKYKFKGDNKVYSVNFVHQELKDFPKWLQEPQTQKLIDIIWKS